MPYHTTLGPAAGPTCSKILAPPLQGITYNRPVLIWNSCLAVQIRTWRAVSWICRERSRSRVIMVMTSPGRGGQQQQQMRRRWRRYCGFNWCSLSSSLSRPRRKPSRRRRPSRNLVTSRFFSTCTTWRSTANPLIVSVSVTRRFSYIYIFISPINGSSKH